MKVILPELKAQGYEFVTVSELIADSKPASTSLQEVAPRSVRPLSEPSLSAWRYA